MPTWLLSPISWIALGLAVLSIAGFGAYGGYRWEEGVAKQAQLDLANYKNKESELALKKFQDTANGITASVDRFGKTQAAISGSLNGLAKDLKDVQAKTPLDPRCRINAERLRIIQHAVATANSTTK